MSDVLHLPAPASATGQRFNLWLSTRTIQAPLIGVTLVVICRASPVNPFVLGCIAQVLTKDWTDEEAVKRFDYWCKDSLYLSAEEAAAFALIWTMRAQTLDSLEGLTPEQVALVRERYAKFVRFCEMTSGVPLEARAPIVTPPAPTVTTPPHPAPTPALPQPTVPGKSPVPVPARGGTAKWKTALKWISGTLGGVLTVGGLFIPDQYEAVLRAVLAAIKTLLTLG